MLTVQSGPVWSGLCRFAVWDWTADRNRSVLWDRGPINRSYKSVLIKKNFFFFSGSGPRRGPFLQKKAKGNVNKRFFKVITTSTPKLTKFQVQIQGEGRSYKRKTKETLANVF